MDLQDLVLRVGNALQTKNLYDQLQREQQKSERLLLNILPESVAARMKAGEASIADHHRDATVLVADLVGFTTLLAQVDPDQVLSLLNDLFCSFDTLVQRLGLEKIKTVGDAYIAAGGINSRPPNHTEAIAALALQMQAAVVNFNAHYNTSIRMRMGISTGPLISGVIGRSRFTYDIWGESVNLACHLEAAAFPGGVLVDEASYERLSRAYRFSGPRVIALKNGQGVTVRTLAPMPLQPAEPKPVPQNALEAVGESVA